MKKIRIEKYLIILPLYLLMLFSLKAQEIGQLAPDFSGKNFEDSSLSLTDFKGKVIVLDFFASWCSPCRKSMPYFIDIDNNYKDSGLVVLAVNLDKKQEDA
jgi:thiol-disulfide isomerase/thioredoxin